MKLIAVWFVVVFSVLLLSACGGGGDSTGTPTVTENSSQVEIEWNYTQGDFMNAPEVNYTNPSSETVGVTKHLNYSEFFAEFPPHDLAILDYNGDGILDVISGNSDYISSFNGEPSRQEIIFLKGNSDGMLELDTSMPNNMIGPEHSRKSLIGDFNLDGYPDVFLVGHGTDHEPWPGEYPMCLMSDGAGGFDLVEWPEVNGFWHSGATVDFDYDGDLDVYLGGWAGQFVLLENVDGILVPTEPSFTIDDFTIAMEFNDLDCDGTFELLLGTDNEQNINGRQRRSYVQDSDGVKYNFPIVENFGLVVAFSFYDIDGDGIKEIFVSRTGSEYADQGWYQGYAIQVLKYTPGVGLEDISGIIIDNVDTNFDGWLIWINVTDTDGDGAVELFADATFEYIGWEFINGKFERAPIMVQ